MATDEQIITSVPDQVDNFQTEYSSPESIGDAQFMQDSYTGGGIYQTGAGLIPHPKEFPPDYAARQAGVFNKNFLKPIVRAMVNPIFSEEAAREITGNAPLFEEFINDCDSAGTSLQDFMCEANTFTRVHGVSFVVMDNIPEPEMPKSTNEALNLRAFPYVYLKAPQDVKEYSVDRFGNLVHIIFTEFITDAYKKTLGIKDGGDVFRFWDGKLTYLAIKKDEIYTSVGGKIEHKVGHIPVIPFYLSKRMNKSSIFISPPPLYDIAKIGYAIFNKDSEIRELERKQGFAMMYGPPMKSWINGTSTYLSVPDGATTPGFASPDSGIEAQLREYSKELKEDIYALAEQNGVTGNAAVDQSGISKAFDFWAHETVLKDGATGSENLEVKISEVFKGYTRENFTFEVSYKEDFVTLDTNQEIEALDKHLLMGPQPKTKGMIQKKMIDINFSDKNSDIVDAAKAEIDAWVEKLILTESTDINGLSNLTELETEQESI